MTEVKELKIQSLTKFYTLALLKSNEPVSGYSILKRLEKDLGKTASPTYIYAFLNNLKSERYIKDVEITETKRSKGVQLTKSGNQFINRIFTRFDNIIELVIQSKLKICASCGVKLYRDFHRETINGKDTDFCCSYCAEAYKNSHM